MPNTWDGGAIGITKNPYNTLNANMDSPLISVIIPVYNGEKYLRPCIDSIIAQTYKNWELLLIDDGSTDSSADICDEYADGERIKVQHISNGGQAQARNKGVAMAKGKYISFVDCDDWLEPTMYETMVGVLQSNHAEIAICGYVEEYASHQKKINADGALTVYERDEVLKLVLSGKIGSYLWSMLYDKDVVKEPMPNLNPYEDHATLFKWVSHTHRIAVLHQVLYHYRQLEGSSLHSYDPKKGNHFFQAIKERYHYVNDYHLLPGWEAENRRLYLRNCIKLTKDLARMPAYDEWHKVLISEVRDELKNFLPIEHKEIGTKYFIRLQMLLLSIDLYVRILRLSSAFSLGRQKRHKMQR